MLIRFNKPYGVLSQFTPEGRWTGLIDHIDLPGVYVAGRLDADSEGLLLLTDDGKEQARIADPRFKMEKTYLVQVEGLVDDQALTALAQGVTLNDEFRKWLASYVQAADGQTAVNRFRSVMQALPAADAGRAFTRDEMNER